MWVAEIAALAAEHDADFVALHMQETGGSDWRTNAPRRAPLAAALAAACPEYWSSGVLCNTDTSDESRFTALSCCFLVRRRALPRVRLWHFGDGARAAGFVTLEDEAAPALAAAALPAQLCRHQRFPQDFFPEFPTWSRKGHLHTRWQLGDVRARAIRRNSPRAGLSCAEPPTARPALAHTGVVRPGQLPQLPRPGQLRLPAARRGGRRRDAVGVRARAEPRPRAHRALGGGGGDGREGRGAGALRLRRLQLPADAPRRRGPPRRRRRLRAARDAELRRVAEGGLLKIPLTEPPPAPARASSSGASSSGPSTSRLGRSGSRRPASPRPCARSSARGALTTSSPRTAREIRTR